MVWNEEFFEKLSPEQLNTFREQHFSYESTPSGCNLEPNYPYDITNDDIDDFGDFD